MLKVWIAIKKELSEWDIEYKGNRYSKKDLEKKKTIGLWIINKFDLIDFPLLNPTFEEIAFS